MRNVVSRQVRRPRVFLRRAAVAAALAGLAAVGGCTASRPAEREAAAPAAAPQALQGAPAPAPRATAADAGAPGGDAGLCGCSQRPDGTWGAAPGAATGAVRLAAAQTGGDEGPGTGGPGDDPWPQSPKFRGSCLERTVAFRGEAPKGVVSPGTVSGVCRDGKETGAVQVEAAGTSAGLKLYRVTYGGRNVCGGDHLTTGLKRRGDRAGALGERGLAIAVPGHWDDKGDWVYDAQKPTFTLSCFSGIVAKCAAWGYVPWKAQAGESLGAYHQACVRAGRAQYVPGKDMPFTCKGTLVDVYDRKGVNTKPNPDFAFESLFAKDRATCLARPRYGCCNAQLAQQGVTPDPATCLDPVPGTGKSWSPTTPAAALIAIGSQDNACNQGLCPNEQQQRPEACLLVEEEEAPVAASTRR